MDGYLYSNGNIMILNISLGVLGIVLYTLIKARPYLQSKEIRTDWGKLFWENIYSWIWSVLIILTVSVILKLVPEANVLIGQLFGGMDLENSPLGFFALGLALSFGFKEGSKEPV